MKKILLFFLQVGFGFVVSVGFLVGLLAAFMIIALLIARFNEGGFYPPDQQMLAKAIIWLTVSCLVATGAWWLYRRCFGHDDSLRLGEEKSPRVEELSFAIVHLLSAGVLSFWLWSVIPREGMLKIPIILIWLVIAFMGMHLGILLHEIGHLAAARIVGFKPRRLHVGTGPVLMLQRFKTGFWIEWRILPQGGFVAAAPRGRSAFRLRWSILIAAGPVTNALILLGGYRVITACYGTIGHSFLQGGGAVAGALFFWVLWTALIGLLPVKGWAGGRRLSTDGYLLFCLWTASNQMLSEWASISDWRKALDLLQSTDGYCNTARTADSPKAKGSAAPSENWRILQGQRNRLASQLLRRSETESPNA